MPLSERCPPEKFVFARRMRKHMTGAERVMWQMVRANRVGPKFRRQSVILGFIADFWCPSRRLVVEVDGASHIGREEYDARRDQAFRDYGIETVRFTNDEVFDNLEGCIVHLLNLVESRPTFPPLSREGWRDA